MRSRVLRAEPVTTAARVVAVLLTLMMAVYFATSDAIRQGNPFLVPDLLLSVLLLASALVPQRLATPAMTFAFAYAAAVWTVSLSTYVVRGAFPDGVEHIALIALSVLMPVLLTVTALRRPPGQ